MSGGRSKSRLSDIRDAWASGEWVQMREAVTYFSDTRKDGVRWELLKLRLETGTMDDESSDLLVVLDADLQQQWLKKIRSGNYLIAGFRLGGRTDVALEQPSIDWLFGRVRLDLWEGELEHVGVCLSGLMVRRVPGMLAIASPVAVEVFNPVPDLVTDRSGAPGRPTSIHVVEHEMRRRAACGEMVRGSMQAEAKHLADWLRETHPLLARLTPKTIQNRLGTEYRTLNAIPKLNSSR